MDYTKVLPASKNTINNITHKLLIRTDVDLLTVVSYKGAGIKYCIRYILASEAQSEIPKDRVFVWLNLKTLATNTFYSNALSTLYRAGHNKISPEYFSILESLCERDTVTKAEFLDFLKLINKDDKKTICFLVEGLETISNGYLLARDIIVEMLRESLEYKVVFMLDVETDQAKTQVFGQLWDYVATNTVSGQEFMFCENDIAESLAEYKVKLEKREVEFLKRFCIGEPSLFKKIVINIEDYRNKNIFHETEISKIYATIGKEWLDQRFFRIANNLTQDSIAKIKLKEYSNVSKYITDSGIVNSGKVYNELFGFYLGNIYKRRNETESKLDLSPQEQQLYELLQKNIGDIVPKEKIAEAIWGLDWETQYSDWALDKLISKTRKKVQELGKENIQVIKKQGVKLSPNVGK